jgi:hypothetical protein
MDRSGKPILWASSLFSRIDRADQTDPPTIPVHQLEDLRLG